jgi:hypothetical protein
MVKVLLVIQVPDASDNGSVPLRFRPIDLLPILCDRLGGALLDFGVRCGGLRLQVAEERGGARVSTAKQGALSAGGRWFKSSPRDRNLFRAKPVSPRQPSPVRLQALFRPFPIRADHGRAFRDQISQ